MSDEHIDELLGAYALDAVDDDERRLVEEHLRTDPRARAEVQELREVASMLAGSSDRPPEGLWDRIAEAIEGEGAPAPGPELARILPARRVSRWRAAAVGGASALVAAAAAVAITIVVLRDDPTLPQDAIAAAYSEASADPASRRTELRSDVDTIVVDAVVTLGGLGFLAADALPVLPDDEAYQLWGVYADEDVISLGVLGNRPGVEPFTAEDDLVQLVITKEQAGGVVSSTNPAFLAGTLT